MEYAGAKLDLKPTNLAFGELVDRLAEGRPARVILEPGDMTWYEILVVPLVGQLRGLDGYSGATVYLMYTPVNNPWRAYGIMAVDIRWDAAPHSFDRLANAHTREVYAAFHNSIREAVLARMEEQDTDANPVGGRDVQHASPEPSDA